MDEDPWLKHLEQVYTDRDNGAKASDPEDLRTLMLRRLVVTFGVDSDYVNSLMPLLVQQFVIEYARHGSSKKCFENLDDNFVDLSDPRFQVKLKKIKRGLGTDPYEIPSPKGKKDGA